MSRKVLLVEPNYKNKYPPMSLMKISSYYKKLGDEVRFFKGDLNELVAELLYERMIEELITTSENIVWRRYKPELMKYIRYGREAELENIPCAEGDTICAEIIRDYHAKFRRKELFTYPPFDIVAVTTLFTFYWDITVKTINFVKQLCRTPAGVKVGGVAASILPGFIQQETGVKPIVGPLVRPGGLGDDNNYIIDQMPLDYSILEEIDYNYPAKDAYFAYMTRGCINHCDFCAVPILEPKYQQYIPLKTEIEKTKERFGEQKNLLLLDNNVLASKQYDAIIDEIKSCGFAKGEKYTPPDIYDITIKNLKDGYNDRGYIRKSVSLYEQLMKKIRKEEERQDLYDHLKEKDCLFPYTATKDAILELDAYVRPLFTKYFPRKKLMRIVDFNQGIDSRLVNDENMAKLSEINIKPLRIAFDHWELRRIYERSIRTAARHGITSLSNYILYNFRDKPDELYYRLDINVRLSEELGVSIFSFPMKYHPIMDPKYFRNRDFIGKNWNRKYIRAIQSILNATMGKVGTKKPFFDAAFGKDIDEFHKILLMPEEFIIYRRKYEDNLTKEWWNAFCRLNDEQKAEAKSIIVRNKFREGEYQCSDNQIKHLLSYYRIKSKPEKKV